MNPSKRADWKNLRELLSFRAVIREATVQRTEFCKILYVDISKQDYDEFMILAREQDRLHHGVNTF